MHIEIDDLKDGKIINLLNVHLQKMLEYSPPESVHALDKAALENPAVTFWSASINGVFAGCGALKALSSLSGEIKSMKTNEAFLRKGVASKLLETILTEAKSRGYKTVSLETGSHQAFSPAIAVYKKYGFVECGPFADYNLDPFSKFYTKEL